MNSVKATHVLTIDNSEQYVVAIAYRPEPMLEDMGEQIAPRLATATEVETGKAIDGYDVEIVLARPVIASKLLERIRVYGYGGEYLGSSQLSNGLLGDEWGWCRGALLSNGEAPQANLSWELRAVERDSSGAIANPITRKHAE